MCDRCQAFQTKCDCECNKNTLVQGKLAILCLTCNHAVGEMTIKISEQQAKQRGDSIKVSPITESMIKENLERNNHQPTVKGL